MRCERYWRDGVLLVEQGRPDPHRDSCLDCRRAHEARQDLVRAFALIGAAEVSDPDWQRQVWRRIAREAPAATGGRRWGWAMAAATAAACAVVALAPRGVRPEIDIVASGAPRRGAPEGPTAASVGDHVRIAVRAAQEVRIYREGKLVYRCAAELPLAAGCRPDLDGLVADLPLTLSGAYQILVAPERMAGLSGSFDEDAAALIAAGLPYQRSLVVR